GSLSSPGGPRPPRGRRPRTCCPHPPRAPRRSPSATPSSASTWPPTPTSTPPSPTSWTPSSPASPRKRSGPTSGRSRTGRSRPPGPDRGRSPPVRVDLASGAWLEHDAAWLPAAEADAGLGALRDELTWEQREIVLFGRRVLQPRLIAWAGDLGYRYSGQTLEPRPFTETAARLLARVRDAAGAPFNHVLVNRYRSGDDSMGLHADDEPELGPDPVVAIVSLGAARRLAVRPRRKGDRARYDLQLRHP